MLEATGLLKASRLVVQHLEGFARYMPADEMNGQLEQEAEKSMEILGC